MRTGPGDTAERASCPVCHDGQADPWEIIRDIRAVMRLQGRAGSSPRRDEAQDVDRFSTEWPLLEVSVRAIWHDLTEHELNSVRADRIGLEALLRRKYGYGTELAHQLCTGVEELHERFNGQWEVIRECVPQFWSEISARDVANMTGTMSELSGLVARRYAKSSEEARIDVAEFLERIDYRMLVRLFGGNGPRSEGAHADDIPSRAPETTKQVAAL